MILLSLTLPKGPGVDTLSTKIYSEVRKGIKPEMYALSTLLFVSVLVFLMMLADSAPKKDESGRIKRSSFIAKRVVQLCLS